MKVREYPVALSSPRCDNPGFFAFAARTALTASMPSIGKPLYTATAILAAGANPSRAKKNRPTAGACGSRSLPGILVGSDLAIR